LIIAGCQTKPVETQSVETPNIDQKTIADVSAQLSSKAFDVDQTLITKGVTHAATLWRASDGNPAEFTKFCADNFITSVEEKKAVFAKLDQYLEAMFGNFAMLGVDLNKNVALNNGPLHEVDKLFAGYNASAHLFNDLYDNKIAFIVALNFPYYPLKEKEELGKNWSTEQWAWARMGDVFSARVPAELTQAYSKASSESDLYISEYNIYMGSLVTDKGETLFPKEMVLLTHWNLRDEIKSSYGDTQKGPEKQQMVYQVMKRIIDQNIPKEVINSGTFQWDPYTNKLFDKEKEIPFTPETDIRYQQIINNFKALQAQDVYYPKMNTYIDRNFSGSMEIAQPEVEILFKELLSSPQVKMVGDLIKKRLGRDLQPYDIWYDGFKSRSSIPAELLDGKNKKIIQIPKLLRPI
ncbi:MAG: hypothetical protein WCX31_21505, partial [Salinivirgaceae bacterium]